MPAANDNFPWMSYYRNYSFFEKKMQEHSKVLSITKLDPSSYNIKLINSNSINVFICECYAFGYAEYEEVCQNHSNINAVVISSNWCSYSIELKRDLMINKVGLYDTAGFMAAINKLEYWKHISEDDRQKAKYVGMSWKF